MHRHWYRFGFGFPPLGFWFRGARSFPRRDEYIRMLEEYKQELEDELKEVNKELEELKKGG
jgi:hypothetical protein